MLSKGKKLFAKASHLGGVHIIYTLYIFAKTLWFFVWLLYISTASLSFYIYNFLRIYIYILLYSVFCVLNFQMLSKRSNFLWEIIKITPYKSINALLDLPLQLENS